MKRAAFATCLFAALFACGGAPHETSTLFDSGATHETGPSPLANLAFDGGTANFNDSSPWTDAPTAKDPTRDLSDGASDASSESDTWPTDSPAKADNDNTAPTDSGASSDAGDASTALADAGALDADSGPPPCGEPNTPCCAAFSCHAAYSCFNGVCY